MNERERRLLIGIALLITVGNGVRLLTRLRPAWMGGVQTNRSVLEPAPLQDAADAAAVFEDERMDVNAASEAHLCLLPGIGPALAARVVEHRRSRGGFCSIEELTDVKGIGPKTLARLRPLIAVTPGPTCGR